MKNRLVTCLVMFLSLPLFAEESPRLIVHLLDYLAKDYSGAVGHDGQILSESEYAEQREFASIIVKAAGKIPALADQKSIQEDILRLDAAISGRSPPFVVTPLARSLQQEIVAASGIKMSPNRWPSLGRGADLYAQNCVTCHGATGAGDGPAGIALDPRPANFRDAKLMEEVAPSGAFNTIRLGVPGTGMPPFQNFSDDEVWALAFYVVSLHHEAPSTQHSLDLKLLEKAATMADSKLQETLGGDRNLLSRVRTYSHEPKNTLDTAKTLLGKTRDALARGDWLSAKQLALRAYLEGIEPVEPRLKGLSPTLLADVEKAFTALRAGIEQKKDMFELEKLIAHAQGVTHEADLLVSDSKLDPRVAFIAASGILLREGFEAALLIVSLLSVIRATGFRRAEYWVHGGWLFAVLLGVGSWFLIGIVFDLSGAQRELLEGGTSLLAVIILLALGFWLHKHSEIERWTKFLKEKVQNALDSKNLLGLASIAFLAVFREAFETVLFLRVLWLDADTSSRWSLISGLGISVVLIIAASWVVLRTSARLPVTQIFRFSSIIMAALAVVLTGKGVHSLQESGWISQHPIMETFNITFLGIYPSTEVLLAQLLVFANVLILWSRKTEQEKE